MRSEVADQIQFWLEDHAVPVFAVLGVGLAVVAFLAFRGPRGGGGESVNLSADQIQEYDSATTTSLHDAQTALDAYAAAHGGSYDGATAAEVEASIPGDSGITDVRVDAAGQSDSITATSGSGGAFTISRSAGGQLLLTCSSPGLGACHPDSTWT
jgi:hypothetical protein